MFELGPIRKFDFKFNFRRNKFYWLICIPIIILTFSIKSFRCIHSKTKFEVGFSLNEDSEIDKLVSDKINSPQSETSIPQQIKIKWQKYVPKFPANLVLKLGGRK